MLNISPPSLETRDQCTIIMRISVDSVDSVDSMDAHLSAPSPTTPHPPPPPIAPPPPSRGKCGQNLSLAQSQSCPTLALGRAPEARSPGTRCYAMIAIMVVSTP